ncbi:MAG: hypothetical protein AMK69_12360 [Nitrospira bacterium SG8_3]|nr:MAG: hypothetical protein AMK69_12360 [Nitrospira bacterium SG8_3]
METEKIEVLKKIILSVEAGTAPDSMDLTPQPSQFEFIYGLGTSGLTPFEIQLADKTVGQEVQLHMSRDDIPQVFQHLVFFPLNLPEHADSFYLKLKIKSVLQADQREVIKALAEIANCEDHCCGH